MSIDYQLPDHYPAYGHSQEWEDQHPEQLELEHVEPAAEKAWRGTARTIIVLAVVAAAWLSGIAFAQLIWGAS